MELVMFALVACLMLRDLAVEVWQKLRSVTASAFPARATRPYCPDSDNGESR